MAERHKTQAASGPGLELSAEATAELAALVPEYRIGPRMAKPAIRAPDVLSEAHASDRPSSFSRGMRLDLPGARMLFLSGTASIDERGATVHTGDFAGQCLRTYRVRTTCYLRDIERDDAAFNQPRTWFLARADCDPRPASTAIQARLCRSDLLVEIEAIAVVPG